MKKPIYLLLLFFFMSSSFTPFSRVDATHVYTTEPLKIAVKSHLPTGPESKDGSMNITISGGTAPYLVQVVSTYSPSELFKKDYIELKKLGTGTYLILVQDADKHVLQEKVELTLN